MPLKNTRLWPRLILIFFFCTLFADVMAAPARARDRGDTLIAKTPPRSPQEEQTMFHLPEGFRIQLVASEPDIIKPINMKFDSAGRLYVTQSVEYPFPVAEGKSGRDTIRRIVDKDGDGIPESVNVFAGGLSIPIGVTPISGGVFAYSIPYLYRFLDKDHDGVAESREVVYRGFESRDTHGMINGLNYWIDGWIYCCHGYANRSKVTATDGSSIDIQSGNTFRARSDGSHIESFSYGQVNPFGLTFDARGDAFTADCHSRPAMLILREGYYQSFGKPHDGLGFAPEMMRHEHGSTGIAGIVIYDADQFPPAWRGTIFLGNPVTSRINHDRLETKGSTPVAVKQPDFLRCDDPWFRPVDLQLAPDGSIYVADFYNCIIGHYEVPLTHPLRDKTRGRIWRISYVGDTAHPARHRKPADLSQSPVDALVAALSDNNLGVRTRATNELVDRIGQTAVKPVRALVVSSARPEARAHGAWVLFRLGALDQTIAETLADDPAPLVRLHAVKTLGEAGSWDAWQRALVRRKLTDADAFVRRAAADALGHHANSSDIDFLADLWRATDPSDAMLVHTTRIALRDAVRSMSDPGELAQRYRTSRDMQRRLIDVTLGVHTRPAAALVLALQQADPGVSPKPAESLEFVAKTINWGRMPEVFRLALAYRGKDQDLERRILISMFRVSRERVADLPEEMKAWAAAVEESLLANAEEHHVRSGIELAAETKLPSATKRLASLVSSPRYPKLRGRAAEALVRIDPEAAVRVIGPVARDAGTPLSVRCDVVEALQSVANPESRELLVGLLKIAPTLLASSVAHTLAHSREGAALLIEEVERGHCTPQLLGDPGLQTQLRAAGSKELRARLEKLVKSLPKVDERIGKALLEYHEGFGKATPNAARGAAVFQKNCAVCHQIAGKGNRVGPQLDGVGNRGLDRMLEDVLDPNRNVDANFRATVLALRDGQILNGFIVREEGPILVLVDSKGKEQRIPASNVEQRTLSALSPMPANVADLLAPQELYDLLGYLLKQRAPGEANR